MSGRSCALATAHPPLGEAGGAALCAGPIAFHQLGFRCDVALYIHMARSAGHTDSTGARLAESTLL
jgi:hypothetical protein